LGDTERWMATPASSGDPRVAQVLRHEFGQVAEAQARPPRLILFYLMEWTQPQFLTASMNGPRWVYLDHLQEEK
jgi:hypothetical protein